MYFNLLTFVVLCFFALAKSWAQEDAKIPTLEEINADLQAKKKELEPFNPSDIKIDLESLGLDDVSQKEKTDENIKKDFQENNLAPLIMEKIEKNKEIQEQEKDKDETKLDRSQQSRILSRIQEIIRSQQNNPVKVQEVEPAKTEIKKDDDKTIVKSEEKPEEKTAIITKSEEKITEKPKSKEYINAQKKKNLQKRAKEEKLRKIKEAQEKERLEKLKELQKKYVDDYEANKNQVDEFGYENYNNLIQSVVPQRKKIHKFLTEEAPPSPIINDYRTLDNLHIPLVITPKERIETLFKIISFGDVATFNEAYKYIKNPNARNQFGDTILTYAILMRKYQIMASILARGADPNLRNGLGYTPIDIALEIQDFDALEILVNNKADLQYVDAFGKNYLMHATRLGILPAVILLIESGIDVNAVDYQGITALATALQYKQDIIAAYLFKHGAQNVANNGLPYSQPQQRYSIIEELENNWK